MLLHIIKKKTKKEKKKIYTIFHGKENVLFTYKNIIIHISFI